MVKTINLTADVPFNHEVIVTLPADVPVGAAEIVVIVASRVVTKTSTLGDLLRSEFFGAWKDRSDITDSLEFARQLRLDAWSRVA